MLRPQRSLALLAQALRRPTARSAVPATLSSSWNSFHPQTSLRNASSTPLRGSGDRPTTKKTPSFAIAAAFEGHEDLEEDEGDQHIYGHETNEDSEDKQEKALKAQFRRGMEKKKHWMQSLASQKDFAAVIKSVADCYAPLYAAMGLDGRCPLLAVAGKETNGQEDLETQFQPLRFDDLLTKTTEQEAMALLVIAKQTMLAMAIVEHREKLTEELEKRAENGAGVVLPGPNVMEDENVVTLSTPFRSFYSWAMSTYTLAGRSYYPKLYELYKLAQDGTIYPTANMNNQYSYALINERRYDEAFDFYDLVDRENLPVNVYFYRQLLVAAAATRNVERLQPILDGMRLKGFKLRAIDYLYAIRTYDNVYFFRERQTSNSYQNGSEQVSLTPVDTYATCLERIRKQEETPEEFEEIVDAAQNVLALFDTMIDIDGLTPRDEALFSRVITAAVIAQECERVPEFLALRAEHVGTRAPLHYVSARMAVNALLLLDKHTEAWGLVRETCPKLEPRQYTYVASILEYLSIKTRGPDIVTLMNEMEKLDMLAVFDNGVIKRVLSALCRSVDSVDDEELLKIMTQFDSVFRLSSNSHQLGVFLRECCYYGRLDAMKVTLRQCVSASRNKRPITKGRVAKAIMNRLENAPEGEVDWAFITEVFEATDLFSVKINEDLEDIVKAASRAYEALNQPDGVERAAERQEYVRSQKKKKKTTKKPRREGHLARAKKETMMINGIPVTSSSEVARRRSSWLRSLATARRLTRPLQLQATAHPRDDEDDDRERDAKNQGVTHGTRSLLNHVHPVATDLKLQEVQVQLHSEASTSHQYLLKSMDEKPAALGEMAKVIQERKLAKLQTEADTGEFSSFITIDPPAIADISRARGSLQKMAKELADPRTAVKRESNYQRDRRQLKAATGKLDRMLSKMGKKKDFKQVEAVAYLWEEEFPQFAGQQKHWLIICEHYALALNYQQRFQDVIDRFSCSFQEQTDAKQSEKALFLLSPRLAESIFVAMGHLREASKALQLLDTMQRHGIIVTKIAYFHVLNALLRDERFADFERVMQLCEEIVTKLPGENVPLSLLPMIMMTAAARGEADRAMKFYSHPSDLHLGPYTEFYFDICLQELHGLGENEMLMEMYRNLMVSRGASRELKERVSKYLFRKKVALVTAATRNKQLAVACEILEIMHQHRIAVSHHAIFPLMRALLLDPVGTNDDVDDDVCEENHCHVRVESAEDLRTFFARYSHALEWNAFAFCEAVVAGVRAHRADLVDNLFVYALDCGMPIKYAALEQVVVFYYRMGLINDLERVADMVRALRLNKHIPLGIAVTEIGMAANLRLHRYEEVAVLFEDFATRDGERRRALKRRFMLKSALNAYMSLGRVDEAQAIKLLLHQSNNNLLEGSMFNEENEIEAGKDAEDEEVEEWSDRHANDEKEGRDSNSYHPRDLELPSLRRFDH
ncbi:hypothetical protein BBP00_00006138 [Phytophthora kernoviae]|uniref:Pentacotripeptide-repeat region of PRORP domain-containing protein n=1 Tax=Phytophthora kernoviae TaxID=325452 RepID=A0A3F2RML4_9STRA|nr:hypothetical protein BBP00_00006138 [Phytophthora kernoviae]